MHMTGREEDQQEARENKAVVRRYLKEVWGQGNLAIIHQVVAGDYIDHTPPPRIRADREGLFHAVEAFHAAVTVSALTVEALVAEGETVVDRWTIQGTQDGPFWGMPATGKAFTLRGIDMQTVRKGRIVESWHTEDILAMLRQLGHL